MLQPVVCGTWLQEASFIKQLDDNKFLIEKGFVPDMSVPGTFYVNKNLSPLLFEVGDTGRRGEGTPAGAHPPLPLRCRSCSSSVPAGSTVDSCRPSSSWPMWPPCRGS